MSHTTCFSPFKLRTAVLCFFAVLTVCFFTGCAGVKDTSRTFKTVVIDAGHGGHDTGARSRSRTLEKHVSLDVAKKLEGKLSNAGFHTVMTRSDDRFIPLGQRSSILNAQHNAIFVSIHFNHARSRSVRGTETYYKSSPSYNIARNIESRLSSLPSAQSRGVKRANFYVLRNARYPAVLVECGFLSNYSEDKRCRSEAYREQIANKIAEAIIKQRRG